MSESEIQLPAGGSAVRALIGRNRQKKSADYQLIWWYQSLPVYGAQAGLAPQHSRATNSELAWRREVVFHGRRYLQVNVFAPVDYDVAKLIERVQRSRFNP